MQHLDVQAMSDLVSILSQPEGRLQPRVRRAQRP